MVHGVLLFTCFFNFLTGFFFETVFSVNLLTGGGIPLLSLDFNLLALFLWIKLVLAALSNAEKTADKFFLVLSSLAFLIKVFKLSFFFLFKIVLFLSFLNFLIALLIIGMGEIVT